MGKIKQLKFLRTEIMIALSEIKMLTCKLEDEDDAATMQIMGSLAYRSAQRAAKLNEKIGRIFKL